ncbi:MAG: hypothetical protein DRH37_00165 [Deltaproteobacteria bacterium]|nr:MAG: hypothetical protein DRH37_00165 [Deltaproteobacteria bacterium]
MQFLFRNKLSPETCISCFQKMKLYFNISELWKYRACMSRISPNAAVKAVVFENSLPRGSADFAESAASART